MIQYKLVICDNLCDMYSKVCCPNKWISKEMTSASNLLTANQIRVMTATKWPYCCTTQCFMVFKINHLVATLALLLL